MWKWLDKLWADGPVNNPVLEASILGYIGSKEEAERHAAQRAAPSREWWQDKQWEAQRDAIDEMTADRYAANHKCHTKRRGVDYAPVVDVWEHSVPQSYAVS